MNLQVVSQNASRYQLLYDDFIQADEVPWRYVPTWTEYQKAYCQKTLEKDCSFMLVRNGQALAFCPLFLETHQGCRFFSYALNFQAAPFISRKLSQKQNKKIEKACFDQIDKFAREYGALKSMFQLNPVDMTYSFNILMKYGYIDSSIQTAVVELDKDIDKLWAELRKSFKSLINNGKKKFNFTIIDKNNLNYDVHERYRKLHHKTAGRVTRAQSTFDLQFEAIKNDQAMLIGLRDGEQYIAFSYFLHDKNSAYYGSSADDPEYSSDIPLEHCIIWRSIEYYKERGLKFLDLGAQQFCPQIFDHPSQKDLTISFFKRGFGAKIIPIFRGIKYFDIEFMQRDLMVNVEKMVENYRSFKTPS